MIRILLVSPMPNQIRKGEIHVIGGMKRRKFTIGSNSRCTTPTVPMTSPTTMPRALPTTKPTTMRNMLAPICTARLPSAMVSTPRTMISESGGRRMGVKNSRAAASHAIIPTISDKAPTTVPRIADGRRRLNCAAIATIGPAS